MNTCSRSPIYLALITASCVLASTGSFAAPEADTAEAAASVPENSMKEAYFGETHVHTSYSLDAYIGGARLTPNDAYRYAKGETFVVSGQAHNIGRPLDFVAVTDHAEFLGEMYSTQVEGAKGYDNPALVELRGLTEYQDQEMWFLKYVQKPMRAGSKSHPPFYAGPETTASAWQIAIAAAAEHYEPGKFTTFAAFEWSAAPNGGNMHRNVIFRDMILPELPISALDTDDEEKLWAWMAEQEKAGSTLLAIPHNSNASKGFMFEPVDNAGMPLTAEYAKMRAKYEPLIEMMQIKGNSEVVVSLWPADEFSDFENAPSLQEANDRGFIKQSFVRWGVTKGLAYEKSLGVNPYKLGFIGGTDSHNGTPSDVLESNYIGSHGGADSTVERRREGDVPGWAKARDINPGAIAGVWATRNTREALWDAMKARETFVTSGPRIKPRFFCGVGLSEQVDSAVALVAEGYAKGVPMGGTLSRSDKAPSCFVHAAKDPEGANLDRIQIIKGWTDAKGEPQERIINVAFAGERSIAEDGSLAAVGNTVDLVTATYTNTIGATELMGVWTDDSFKAEQAALYYVRVLEIPTPRWTTYDAVKNKLPLLDSVSSVIQERAWTSPIWYTP